MRNGFPLSRIEGTASRQAHADLPEGTFERELGKVNVSCELPVRVAEAPSPRGEPLERRTTEQNRHGLAPARELHHLAVLCFANQ